MRIDLINDIVNLRIAVSYLAEKNSWWGTNFYDSSANDFLTYIFPKSRNTQFSCSSSITRHFIDAQVGANYYHLFRLPVSFEELIHKNEMTLEIHSMESEDEAIALLTKIADGLSINGSSGPKNIGSVDELEENLVQVFAAEYVLAFKSNIVVHPYLN